MNREVHVRFWEGLGVQLPWATQLWRVRVTFKRVMLPQPTHT